MIGIFTFLLFLIFAGVYAMSAYRSNRVETTDRYGSKELATRPRYFIIIGGIVVAGIIAAIVQPYAIEKVDVAHIGLRVNLIGDERGLSDYRYKSGWVPYNTYTEEVVEIPSSQQHVDYPAVTVYTKGGFAAEIAPSFDLAMQRTAELAAMWNLGHTGTINFPLIGCGLGGLYWPVVREIIDHRIPDTFTKNLYRL